MSSSTPEFKAALPADFSGDPADSIRWIKAMRAYFAINSKLYSIDEIKVMTTLNKMSKGRDIDFSEMWYDRMSNTAILIGYFSSGIPTPLMQRIYSMETVPNPIDDWYKCAQKFQTQYEHAKEVENRRKGTTPIFRPLPSSSTPAKDPNAMDVDVIRLGKLSQEEREKCFKQGLCFRCRKPRHT